MSWPKNGVCGIILGDNGNALIGKKCEGVDRPMAGQWMIPGGKYNAYSELPIEALKRELSEETGVVFTNDTIITELGAFSHESTGWLVTYYIIENADTGELNAGDGLSELAWVDGTELADSLGPWALSVTDPLVFEEVRRRAICRRNSD